MTTKVKSQKLVPMQIAPYPESTFHLQGMGQSGNRSYGVAVNIIQENLDLSDENYYLPSLASTGRKYTPCYVGVVGKNLILITDKHVNKVPLNTIVDLDILKSYISAEIKKCSSIPKG